jgi:hypothetical protein
MSIENYKWSDGQLLLLSHSDDEIHLEFTLIPEIFSFNKQDSIAIAKHFNVDRESLVEGIKEIIDIDVRRWAKYGKGLSRDEIMMCLQKLITKEDIEE